MGFHSNLCLKETTNDALKKGFNVYTSPNLITDYTEEKKKESLTFYEENCVMINFND